MVSQNRCAGHTGSGEPPVSNEGGTIENALELKAKYRKVVQAGIAHWIKDFQNGRIQIETVNDLKTLIEIDLELQKDELCLRKWKAGE